MSRSRLPPFFVKTKLPASDWSPIENVALAPETWMTPGAKPTPNVPDRPSSVEVTLPDVDPETPVESISSVPLAPATEITYRVAALGGPTGAGPALFYPGSAAGYSLSASVSPVVATPMSGLVGLTWRELQNHGDNRATSYDIYRAGAGSGSRKAAGAVKIGSVTARNKIPAVDNSFVDVAPLMNQTARYWVVARLQGPGAGEPSEIELGAPAVVTPPAVPDVGSLVATAHEYPGQLSWDPEPGATSYTIYGSDVDATGLSARTGIAGQNFGALGGGVQVQLLQYGASFTNPRPLNGVVR